MARLQMLALMGPTASGKTSAALALAQQFPIEIISVDSALVYRGLDIGSAKPTPDELRRVPHHLIDIKDPKDAYSAAEFIQDAKRAIDVIQARGKIPCLVGGTMLYFKALFEGLSVLPQACAATRQSIYQEAADVGWLGMHQQLASIDPQSAQRIHPNDQQRLVRALEVYRQSGQTLTDWIASQMGGAGVGGDVCLFALVPPDRCALHRRINQRFDAMVEAGLVGEVQDLFERDDLHEDLPAMRSVGYRQVWDYLAGHSTFDQMIERGKAASRQLAKRQLTWLRGWDRQNLPPYRGFEAPEALLDYVSKMLKPE